MKNFDIYDRIARIEPMDFSGSESTGDFIYEYDKAGNIVKLTKPDKQAMLIISRETLQVPTKTSTKQK